MTKMTGMARQGRVDTALTIAGIAMAIYHLVYTQYMFQGPLEHYAVHYGFALILVFLMSMRKANRKWQFALLSSLIVMAIVAVGYMKVFYNELELRGTMGQNTTADLVIGAILVLLAIESCRRSYGGALPVLAVCFIAFALLGHLVPGFRAPEMSISSLIARYSVGLSGGLFGTIMSVSANYIFLFVLFGGVLEASHAFRFFSGLGKLAARGFRGGPALSAVVSSLMIGMVSGSSMANVAIAGSFTIPLMKRAGYSPQEAGGIEAAASTGGQIMPPVMGAAAFAMAGIIGVPYIAIVKASVIPAILYFLSLAVFVQLKAMKRGIAPVQTEKVDAKTLLLASPVFFVPLFVIMYLLLVGYSAMFAAFWAITSIIVTQVLVSFFTKEHVAPRQWIHGFAAGALGGAQVAVAAAILGPVVDTIIFSGLGLTIPSMVENWSGGYLVVALAIAMVASLILGMGMPTIGAYVLVALVAAPALVRMGASVFQAHMFAFFFGVFSCDTPPVAVAALVASQLAQANYMKTGWEATKVASAGFLLPYLMVFAPGLLLQAKDPLTWVLELAASAMALLCVAILLTGYFLKETGFFERALFGACAALSVASVAVDNYSFLAMAGALFVVLGGWQWWVRRKITKAFVRLGNDE